MLRDNSASGITRQRLGLRQPPAALNQRVRSNANRQNQSLRAAKFFIGFGKDEESKNCCSQFAQRKRREKFSSHARAMICRACAHDISPRLKAASGSAAI